MHDALERSPDIWFASPKAYLWCVRRLDETYAAAKRQNRAAEFTHGLMDAARTMPALPLKCIERIACFAKEDGTWAHFADWAVNAPAAHMTGNDHIAVVNETRDPDIAAALCRAKYGAMPLGASEPHAFLARARQLAKRIHLWPAALDGLFVASELRMSRPKWEARVRTAIGANMLLRDMDTPAACAGLIDAQQIAAIDRGTLILGAHVGFFPIIRAFLHAHVPDTLYIGATGTIVNDPRTALFTASRALSDGHVVFIAPNGRIGTQSEPMPLLGTSVTLGIGAAFLAYESDCPVVWLSTGLGKNGFSVAATAGPARQAGETYAAFSARLSNFYLDMLRRHFTSDPIDMAMEPRWLNHFWRNSSRRP